MDSSPITLLSEFFSFTLVRSLCSPNFFSVLAGSLLTSYVDSGRPYHRNNAPFFNFSGVVWTRPETLVEIND